MSSNNDDCYEFFGELFVRFRYFQFGSIADKPLFDPRQNEIVDLIEGQKAEVNMTALSNPSEIDYLWSNQDGTQLPATSSVGGDDSREMKSLNGPRDAGLNRIYSENGVLVMKSVQRTDSGVYTVKASNEEGVSQARIRVNVQYPPR